MTEPFGAQSSGNGQQLPPIPEYGSSPGAMLPPIPPMMRSELYPGEMQFFQSNPQVSGMAAEDGKVILNPFSNLSPEERDAVYSNELSRLYMRENGAPQFALTPDQRDFFQTIKQGSPYGSQDDIRSTIAARLLSGDPSAGQPTQEQLRYVEELKRRMGMGAPR